MPVRPNPILPGFNPDPSILRVGEDYYIATSTFEWYPGVQIHHSKDLANWTLITRPLNRKSQLDMRGNPDSCGVWAPCLSHDGEKFWLVYTDVKRKDGAFKDAHNYIVTATDIMGPWSDPVYVNSSGFDPRSFTTRTGKNGSSTCSGTTAAAPQVYRHCAAAMGPGNPKTRRGPQEHFQGHRAGAGRGAASLSAQWLVLPFNRRGRHGV